MLGARNRTSKTHPHGPHRYYPSVCTRRTNLSKPFWLRLKITLGNPKTCRGLRGHRGASARAADTSRSPRPRGGARTPRCGNRKLERAPGPEPRPDREARQQDTLQPSHRPFPLPGLTYPEPAKPSGQEHRSRGQLALSRVPGLTLSSWAARAGRWTGKGPPRVVTGTRGWLDM